MKHLRWLLAVLSCAAIFAIVVVVPVLAIDCTDDGFNQCKSNNDANLCSELSKVCQQKINDSVGQQKTLSSTISYLNTRIRLTETEITKTQFEINTLEKEIDQLQTRIDGLEVSLQRLTEELIERIQDSYIHHEKIKDPILLLFSSQELSDFFTQYKYIQMSQSYTQNLIKEAESQKVTFKTEKDVKEQKQDELDVLKKKLVSQRVSLQDQQQQKKSLLSQTQNDERKYQSLMQQAQDQVRAFSTFVASQGGSSLLSGQSKCDGWGCYYNQRDAEWGNQTMGLSSERMKDVGCLVTSMAMVASHYVKNMKPRDIAASSAPFFGSTAYMNQGTWTVNGVTMTRTRIGYSASAIDQELNQGRPVVVGLFSSSNPSHFIVIRGKNDKGYIMNDPFLENGGDRPLSDKYTNENIRTVDKVSTN